MEDNNKETNTKDTKNNIPKRVKTNNNSTIILRHRALTNNVAELEEEYSKRFGCKVIILESNLDYVGKIDD